jgi:hypothetical protein
MKALNIKRQAPGKLQTTAPNEIAADRWIPLELGIGDLFGAWSLGFGVF